MINNIYIIILCSFAYCSMLELYGTGERYNQIGAQGIGLGDTYFFSDYTNKLNTSSVATFSQSNLTRVTFSPQLSSDLTSSYNSDIIISFFSFSFPIGNSKTISFGLLPYTRSNIRLLESDGYSMSQNSSDFIDLPLNSHSEYEFYGGISNFYSSFSMGLGSKNSFAFKFNKLFGNQMKVNKIIISSFEGSFDDSTSNNFIEQDSTSKVILNQFSGYSLQFDWIGELNNHQFGLSATSMGPINVFFRKYYDIYSIPDPLERYYFMDYSFLNLESGDDLLQYDPYYSNNISDEIDFSTFLSDILNRINDYKIGYHYHSENIGFIFEFHKQDMFENSSLQSDDVNILNNSKPSTTSYHLGFYNRFDNSRSNFFNSISLRLGGYYKEYMFEGSAGSDIALTFGIGAAINDYFNLIDFGVKIGQIKNTSFENENYIKANLSIDVGERWFSR